jgi:hypothetical protein
MKFTEAKTLNRKSRGSAVEGPAVSIERHNKSPGAPSFALFAKGGIFNCSRQDLFFPPLPNGTARMGHPAFALFIRSEVEGSAVSLSLKQLRRARPLKPVSFVQRVFRRLFRRGGKTLQITGKLIVQPLLL